MKKTDIETKIAEEKKALEDLEAKKKKLEEKIALKKKKIDDYENILMTKQYSDIDNQLDSLGVSREELLNALMNGDLLALQDRILNQQNEKTDKLDNENMDINK